MKRPTTLIATTFATGLVAALLPFGPALADDPTESPSPTETTEPTEEPTGGFGGYTTAAWAAPVKVEIYEPMIPIPTSPQLELEIGYSEVESDSSSSRGRSSFLWPGDSVGEGFKTIVEGVGLPPALGKDGYPVQVNSLYPSGPERDSDEPLPGMIQRAGSGEGSAYAENGWSTDGQAQDRDGEEEAPGLIPGLPLPGVDGLLSSPTDGDSEDGEEAPSSLGLPPALGAVVDVGGFTSVSRTEADQTVTAMSRSSFGDVAILGGLIRLEGLKVRAEVSSDGAKGQARGVAAYGELVALGQRFAFGPDGFEAAGQAFPIPGLPDEASKALEKMGITVSIPKPVYEKDGASASAAVAGLVIQLDMKPLKALLDTLPLADLLNSIPEEAGQLKDVLGLVTGLSSRMVLTLGNAKASVATSPLMEPPGVEPEEPETEEPAEEDSPGDAAPPSAPPPDTPPSTDTPPGTTTDPPADLTDAAPAGAGLPPLFSIPGLLMLGGIAAATLAGSYFRKLGAAALGGGAPCPHGLASGLPDLREA